MLQRLLLLSSNFFSSEHTFMMQDDRNDAERVVFWVIGAVVTLLLAALIVWKLFFNTPIPAAIATSAPVEQITAANEVSVPVVEAPPVGDNLPKFLGSLKLVLSPAGKLSLTGSVPTERKKERLLSQARLVFGFDNVVDEISVSESAPILNWKGKTLDLMAQLATLGPFSLTLNNDAVAVDAKVPDDTIKSAWIDWLANFFVDRPLAVDASLLRVDSLLPAQASFDLSTLFNLAVNFASGSFEIPEENKAALDSAAEILQEDGRTLRIVGHTDSTGNADANRVLSEQRANSVREYLVAKGVNPQKLSSYGLGQDRPIADNDTDAGRAKNRRIEFAQ
jgi:OmpA-OmpF porin, OOP family